MYADELNPLPVDPTPTLTPSISTLSPTTNGNVFAVLNPTSNVTVAYLVTVLNPTVLIPTPVSYTHLRAHET